MIQLIIDALYVAHDAKVLTPKQNYDIIVLIDEFEKEITDQALHSDGFNLLGLHLLIDLATKEADKQARQVDKANSIDHGDQNFGQIVAIKVDGRSKLAGSLKQLGFKKDYYWGFTLAPMGYKTYAAQITWADTLAQHLRNAGISATRIETII